MLAQMQQNKIWNSKWRLEPLTKGNFNLIIEIQNLEDDLP